MKGYDHEKQMIIDAQHEFCAKIIALVAKNRED